MNAVKIIPLGGVREEGKNMYVVEIDEAIYVLDCGLVFPEDEMLGIDAVIPDFTYLEENKERVVGIFLSHGHADAMGALPYLLDTLEAPVFGTDLTIELAKLDAKAAGLGKHLDNFFVIDAETEIEFETSTVSFFKTTHTIPESVGIVLSTPLGAIVYTGDFKFDSSASELYKTDFGRLTDIGEKGVLALLSDSADAEILTNNDSVTTIVGNMADTFMNTPGRVIIASIGSNIARIQQVLNAAHLSGRTVFFGGNQLMQLIDVAIKLDKIQIPSKDVIGQMKDMTKTPDDKIIVLETGNVGEPIKALQAMANNRHKTVHLKEGDLVYIGTTPSVAMETTQAKTADMIYRAGASVRSIKEDAQVSGHANKNDLQFMLNFLKPHYLIPVNGESRTLHAHAKLAQELAYTDDQILMPVLGDVIEFKQDSVNIAASVPAGDVLVDGSGVGDIGNVVLRDRRILSEDGIFVVVATISRRLKRVLVGPQITSRGFVFMKTSLDLIEECSDMTLDVLEEHLAKDDFDWGNLKSDLREKIGKYLFKETKRRPVILPIIMEGSSYQPEDEG